MPDPLTDLLSLLNVRSFLSRRLEASGSWALRFPDYRHMKFGGIIEGARWIWIEGVTKPLRLEEGDFYLLSHGGPYCFASDVEAKAVDGIAFLERHLQADGVVRFGKGEERSVCVGGRFLLDEETSAFLLPMLPPILHLRANQPQARALRAVLNLLTFETEAARPGGAAIADGLCAIVLVNILRAYLDNDERPRGWFGALRDHQIGTALRLLHRDAARRWKVGDLASAVGMSRTAFADRFKRLVGMAPLEYAIHWRMMVARDALKNERWKLVVIAEAVGYDSETAFSLAFKRKFGISPGRYRSDVRCPAFAGLLAADG